MTLPCGVAKKTQDGNKHEDWHLGSSSSPLTQLSGRSSYDLPKIAKSRILRKQTSRAPVCRNDMLGGFARHG